MVASISTGPTVSLGEALLCMRLEQESIESRKVSLNRKRCHSRLEHIQIRGSTREKESAKLLVRAWRSVPAAAHFECTECRFGGDCRGSSNWKLSRNIQRGASC